MRTGPAEPTPGVDPLIRRVEQTIARNRLLQGGDRVLVAVSGGADSVCLLVVLKELSKRLGFAVCAFHLNHKLRGADALADEHHVRELCAGLGVSLTVRSADVRGIARRRKQSLEDAGRQIRYQFLLRAAQAEKANKVATGHSADDNAETVLMNLVRGAGGSGLCGIPVARELSSDTDTLPAEPGEGRRARPGPRSPAIIRPIIELQRVEIEAFLSRLGISWCVDSSNSHLEFRRNVLRHKVVPVLKEMNPNLTAALTRSTAVLSDENRYLDRLARRAAGRLAAREDGSWTISVEGLLRCDIALQRRIVRVLVPGLDADHVNAVLELAGRPNPGRIELRQGRQAWKEGQKLVLETDRPAAGFLRRQLPVPGKARIPELAISLEAQVDRVSSGVVHAAGRESFDLKGLKLPLFVRVRAAGDRMVPFGGTEKKLKEIMIDDKIPLRRRDRLPILCDRQGILWVIGGRRAERARIGPDTREVLTVSVK